MKNQVNKYALRIDCLQYSNWSREIFLQLREAGLDAVHVTIAYHEDFQEMVRVLISWNRHFEDNADIICRAGTLEEIHAAKQRGCTAIIFGFQNPSPIEADIGLVEICHQLGVRFMQLSYNNQSLLATGCYEMEDPGITRMGREVIAEMNRVGMVMDMSHSSTRSTLEAIEISQRPIAITHANPAFWHPARRNKPDDVLKALAKRGGMLGFSLYPHHLKDGSQCSLSSFCLMIAKTADMIGVDSLGIGSDLCLGQPDSVVEWMRNGRWTRSHDYGEGSASAPGFPAMPDWFQDSRGFHNLAEGLAEAGFQDHEIQGLLGGNWARFFEDSFVPQVTSD